jgi:hypothetical protein
VEIMVEGAKFQGRVFTAFATVEMMIQALL